MELMATGDRGKAVLKAAQRLMKRKKEVEKIFLQQLSAESLSKNPFGETQAGRGLEPEHSSWSAQAKSSHQNQDPN